MKVVWSAKAGKEVDNIYKYWVKHNLSNLYSEKLLDEILRMINLIMLQPNMGTLSEKIKVRRILIFENFSLYYTVKEKNIRIISFLDNRQDPQKKSL